MNRNVKIGKLFGIEIDLHYSWFLIVVLLAWGLASQFFPASYPDFTTNEYWFIGVISAVLLFVSVLIHELSHSLVAKSFKIPVDKITLFFFGGIASIGGEHMTPKKEFWMALAGPLVSLFLALVFYIVFVFTNNIFVEATVYYLWQLNLILGLFNLAPGFPLDGGRVFRAILWHFTGDVKKSTWYASQAGKLVALILIVTGFIGMFMGQGTLWFVLLGIFLYFLAGMSYEQIIIKEVLSKVKVRDVMLKKFISVKSSLSLASLFNNYFLKYSQDGFLVVDDNKFLGIVVSDSLNKVPKKKWASVRVKDILSPIKKSVSVNDNAYHVLMLLSKNKLSVIPVIKNKKLVGVVDSFSLARFVKFSS